MASRLVPKNYNAFRALDERINALRSLKGFAAAAAPEVAVEFRKILEANIAAGVDCDGKPWPLTKDGHKALRNGAAALTVTSVGSVILAEITGPTSLHNLGAVKGKVTREILPQANRPEAYRRMSPQLIQAVTKVFTKMMGEGTAKVA